MIKNILTISVIILTVLSCQNSGTTNTDDIGKRYYEIYANQGDNKQLMSFYADSVTYENITLNSVTENIPAESLIRDFISWNSPEMIRPSKEILVVESMLTNDSTIVAYGYYTPYLYNGNEVPSMKFISWMQLDKDKRIKKQSDWFNYTIQDLLDVQRLKENLQFGE